MRQSERATTRQLAEYRARICLMGLKELRFSWDANNWILQLFYQFLDSGTAKTLNIADFKAEHALPRKAQGHHDAATNVPTQPVEGLDGLPAAGAGNGQETQPVGFFPATSPLNLNDLDDSELELDFMSQLLNFRGADDAFLNLPIDPDSSDMNLDGFFR